MATAKKKTTKRKPAAKKPAAKRLVKTGSRNLSLLKMTISTSVAPWMHLIDSFTLTGSGKIQNFASRDECLAGAYDRKIQIPGYDKPLGRFPGADTQQSNRRHRGVRARPASIKDSRHDTSGRTSQHPGSASLYPARLARGSRSRARFTWSRRVRRAALG